MEVLILVGIFIMGLSYYFIFREHHKRNEMTFSEIYPIVIEYMVTCIMSVIFLAIGVSAIRQGYVNNDEVSEVIKELTTGIIIISLVIIHFVFWVKKHLQDIPKEVREVEAEKTNNIAEWIELIAFIGIIVISIFNIFKYMQFIDPSEKYKQIGYSVIYIFSSILVLYKLNPLQIKDKIRSKLKKGSK